MLRKFWGDLSGSIIPLTAFLIPALFGAVAVSVDYSMLVNKKIVTQRYVDSALLVGAKAAKKEILAGSSKSDAIKTADKAATAHFETSLKANAITISDHVFKKEFEIDEDYVSVSGSLEFDNRMLFSNFVSKEKPSVALNSSVQIGFASYINFNFLFDVSGSMGIGATDFDQQRVAEVTNCAFACHVSDTYNGKSKYERARANGAEMRIDVVRSAAVDAIEIIEKRRSFDNQFSVGAHIFDNEVVTIIKDSDKKASDLDYVKSVIDKEVLMRSGKGTGGTNIDQALSDIADMIPDAGGGTAVDDAREVIIVFTDGVESTQACCWYFHPLAVLNTPYEKHAPHEANYAMDVMRCKKVREKNIEVYFIYTPYLEQNYGKISDHDANRFGFIQNSLFNIIPKRFSECAGGDQFVHEASSPDNIREALTRLVGTLVSPLRVDQ